VSEDTDAVAEQLASIADSLADLALDRLRRASDSVRSGEAPDPALVAEEKRITRARRAVEKAAQLLGGPSVASGGLDDGP
jgi:hypothetical protein